MSRKLKIKHLTSEELKSKLYAHFQKSGSLDHLRTQLRGQLVSELFKVAEPIVTDKYPNSSDVDKCLLPVQVCNWLIYDHLSRQDYQYSLSTFVTEAQLPYPEKFLTAGDILGLLGLSYSAAEFESVNKLYTEKNELGYLHSLLLAIVKALFNVPNKDLTLNQSHYQHTEVDSYIERKTDNGQNEPTHSFTRNRPEATGHTSFPDDFSKSKQLSLNKSLSNDNIKSVDVSFHEQLQSVKEESEKAVQKLRHKLLEELENLHSQERKMQLEIEHTKSELRKEQNKLLKEREILKEKEVLLEKEMINKLEMKMRDAETDFASKLHFKDKEIESLKMKLSEKDQKLTHLETELESEKDYHILMKKELEDLKHMYKIIQDKYSSVLDENTNLLKKFESMSDYTILKEELAAKSKEVTQLQNEIKDIHQRSEIERKEYVETVRNLEDKLNLKEPQLIKAKKELDHVKNTLSTEENIWNKERRKLEQELNEFKELYKTVLQRMEDQKEDIEDLHKTIQILNYKLINNTVNIAKSESFASYKSFQRAADISQKRKPETLFTKRNVLIQQQSEKYNDSSLKFLSDAKSRFSKLKEEEDAVQEKYSFVFSTIPVNNEYKSHFGNYVSLPKSSIEYSQASHAKPISINSAFTFDNWSKNKIEPYAKNPYSLNNVKTMISHSLFPYKSSNQISFQTRNLDSSTEVSNTVNSQLNDSWKVLEKHPQYSSNKECVSFESNDKTSILSTSHGNISNKNKSLVLDNSLKDNSQDKELDQNQEVAIDGKVITDNSNNLEQGGENENSEKYRTSEKVYTLSDANKNVISPYPERSELMLGSQEFVDQNNTVVPTETQMVLPETTEKLQDTMSMQMENKPKQSSSVLVNLDAAWKERSSISSLPYIGSAVTDGTNTKYNSDVCSSISVNKTFNSKEDTPDLSQPEIKSNTSDGLKEHLNKTTENTNNEKVNQNTDATSDIQIGSTTELEHKDTTDRGCDSENQVRNTELETPKQEQGNLKSTEKIGSADSLSELSEIHLSCGSEAEQKEDSDAW